MELSEEMIEKMFDTLTATTLATHGLVICNGAGVDPSPENVFKAIGHLLHPEGKNFDRLRVFIEKRVEQAMDSAKSLSLDVRRR